MVDDPLCLILCECFSYAKCGSVGLKQGSIVGEKRASCRRWASPSRTGQPVATGGNVSRAMLVAPSASGGRYVPRPDCAHPDVTLNRCIGTTPEVVKSRRDLVVPDAVDAEAPA